MVTFETALRCLLSACLRRRPKAAEDSIATIVLLLCSGLETALRLSCGCLRRHDTGCLASCKRPAQASTC